MVNLKRAISVAVISGNKILLARKKQVWILPGGKPEKDESDIDCVKREISEEVIGLEVSNFSYYGAFEGMTPHKGDMLEVTVYLAEIVSMKKLHHGAEIEEIIWLDAFATETYPLSDITRKIIKSLFQAGHLKKGRTLTL